MRHEIGDVEFILYSELLTTVNIVIRGESWSVYVRTILGPSQPLEIFTRDFHETSDSIV